MKKITLLISFAVFLLSVLIYCIGRWLVRPPMADNIANWFLWSGSISAAILLLAALRTVPLNRRHGLNTAGVVLIIVLAAFGGWGLFSNAGQKRFPEMSGLIPYAALILSGIFALFLIVINLLWRKKRKRVRFI